MKLLTVLLLFLAVAQTRPGSVQGVVVKAGTNEVLADTPVELSLAAGGNTRYTATTNSAGQFVFTDVPVGDYRLTATRTGYLRSEYGQRGPIGRGLVFPLAAGQQIQNARVELTETAAVSGRISNADGQPYPNVQVQALRYGYVDGQRVLKTVRSVMTNDLGEYRVFWLPPGSYVLMAVPIRGGVSQTLMIEMAGGGIGMRPLQEATGQVILAQGEDDPIPLFFPGTTTPQTAKPVDLEPGANVRGVDFTFVPFPARRIRGTVSGLPSLTNSPGLPPPTLLVAIQPRGEITFDEASAPRHMTGINPATGAFELNGVFPGSYWLGAFASTFTGRSDSVLRSRIAMDVVGSDIDNVSLRLGPVRSVAGQMSIEGLAPGVTAPPLNRIRVRGRPGDLYAGPDASGAFVVNDLRDEDTQIWIENLPAGAYLKSIRMGSRDVLAEGLRVAEASSSALDVVIGMKAAAIGGSVLDTSGKPATNVVIALVPEASLRNRPDLYKNGFTDAGGRFRFAGVAPGNYKIFVWTDVEDGAWQNAQFIQRFEETGKPIRVEESADQTLQVTLP